MPDKKISELTATTTIGDADLLTTVQGGTNKKITGLNTKTEINNYVLDQIKLNGLDLNDKYIHNLSLPAVGTDGANKDYVDHHPGTATEVYDDLSSQILVGGETNFNLSSEPLTAILTFLYLNGQKLTYGVGADFNIVGTVLTYTGIVPLVVGDKFHAYYDYSAGGAPLAQLQTYYVGDAGDDSFNGRNYDAPVKTLAQAITLVLAQTPSSTNRFEIQIIGATEYTENITIPTYTKIIGSSAKLTGTVTMSEGSALQIKEHVIPNASNGITVSGAITAYVDLDKMSGGNASVGVEINTGGTLRASIKEIDLTGAGSKFYNLATGGILYVNGEKLRENAASTNDGSGAPFLRIADYGSNADTLIQNVTGDIILDSKGHVTKIGSSAVGYAIETVGNLPKFPYSPSFEAYQKQTIPLPQTNVTGDGTLYRIIFNDEIRDVGNHYNDTTGIFVVPANGDYIFYYTVALTGFAAHTQLEIFLTAGSETFYSYDVDPTDITNAANEVFLSGSAKHYLAATDQVYVNIRVSGGAKVISLKGLNFSKFSGFLLTK